MAIAIAVTMTLTAALSAVPAAAVSADCTDDFLIPDSEPLVPRSLSGSAAEVGKEDVTASGGDEKVTVRLESLDDKLEFGVFVLDSNNDCVSATSLDQSDCGASETLSTMNQAPSVETTCRIDAPSSGSVDYFFHVENQQSDALDYSIWMSK
jgi:hypothetical protein